MLPRYYLKDNTIKVVSLSTRLPIIEGYGDVMYSYVLGLDDSPFHYEYASEEDVFSDREDARKELFRRRLKGAI